MSGPQRFEGRKEVPRPGISATEADKLRSSIAALEKDVRELRDKLDERNQWNSTVRGWVGTRVSILVATGLQFLGTLKWLDRYTICIMGYPDVWVDGMADGIKHRRPDEEIIIHKGQLVSIQQTKAE